MTTPQQQFQVPPGLVVITTYGSIMQQTAKCMMESRSFNEKNGLANIAYEMFPGALVEKARNEAVRSMLRNNCGWLLFVDGDMVWAPDAIFRIVEAAYGLVPQADVMGAWCPLRGELALPTIDSGTGTWESWYPNSGIVNVMRTGGAFLLVKRHVFEAIKDPWFRMRVPARPIDFMAEVDNFARIKCNGRNPFREMPEGWWEKLEKCAQEDPSSVPENFVPVEVGEDSGFCDRAKLAGFQLFVNTNVAIGHLDTVIRTAADHKTAMGKMEEVQRLACGLLA